MNEINPLTRLEYTKEEQARLDRYDTTGAPSIKGIAPDVYSEEAGEYFRDDQLDYRRAAYFDDADYQRADLQSGWELFGKSMLQMGAEATLGAVEGIGYGLDIPQIINAVKGGEAEFDNWLSKPFRELKESIQEYAPIYQTKEAESGSLGQKMFDPTWWASQGKTMGTTLSLMIPSVGIARGVGAIGQLARISAKTAGVIAGVAAGGFSRSAESTMEAHQKLEEAKEYWNNNQEFKKEQFEKFKPGIEALKKEYDELVNNIPNPGSSNSEDYRIIEAQRQNRIKELEADMQNVQSLFEKEFQTAVDKKAGEEAAFVYGDNMKLMPLDMLQYGLLLKPLSGFKKAADVFNKSTAGKIAGGLAIQPGSEAIEEGSQFVFGEEASSAVREGTERYGEGFGERLSEYVKDPHFHEAVALGAGMGLLFSGAGPMVRKSMEKANQKIDAFSSTRIAKNPNKVKKIYDEYRGEFAADKLVNGNIERTRNDLTDYMEEISNSQTMSEEEKAESIKQYEGLINDLNEVEEYDSKLMEDDRFSTNDKLRHQYAATQFENNMVNENIDKYTSQYNDAWSKAQAEMSKLTIESAPNSNTTEVETGLTELLQDRVHKQSLEKTLKKVSRDKKLKNRKVIEALLKKDIKSLEGRIKLHEEGLANKTTGFDPKTFSVSNINELNESREYLDENRIKKRFEIQPLLNGFAAIKTEEEANEKEEVENKNLNDKAKKAAEKEVADRLNEDLSSEELKSLEDRAKQSELSKETLDAIANKRKAVKINEEIAATKAKEEENRIAFENAKAEQAAKGMLSFKEKLRDANTINKVQAIIDEIEAIKDAPKSVLQTLAIAKGKLKNLEKKTSNKVEESQSEMEEELPASTEGFETLGSLSDEGAIIPPSTEESAVVETQENKGHDPEIIIQPLPEDQTEEDENHVEKVPFNENRTVLISRTKEFEEIGKDKNGKTIFRDSHDDNGNLIIARENLDKIDLAEPGKLNEGTKMVIRIDNSPKLLTDATNNNELLPIAVQTLEDYEASKKPSMWIRVKKKSTTDIALREFVYKNSKNKDGSLNTSKIWLTTVNNNGESWTNRTKEAKPIGEQLKGKDGNYTNDAFITFSTNSGRIEVQDNNGENQRSSKGDSGRAYVMIRTANNDMVSIPIRQKPISEHSDIREEWTNNTFGLITEFIKGNVFNGDIDMLRSEVRKYFNLNKSISTAVSTGGIKLAKEGDYNNFFGFGRDNKGNYILQLPGFREKGKAGHPYQEYIIKKFDNGNYEVHKYDGKKADGQIKTGYNKISEAKFNNDVTAKLSNMYPNIVAAKTKAHREGFVRYEYKDGKLEQTKPEHYYDFLSNNGVATTKVHGLQTTKGKTVFTTSPIVEINSDTDSFAEVSKKKSKEAKSISEEIKDVKDALNKNSDQTSQELPPEHMTREELDKLKTTPRKRRLKIDPKKKPPKSEDNLLSDIDYNNSSLRAFNGNDDIVNTLTTYVLAELDYQKSETGYNDIEEAMEIVRLDLEAELELFKENSDNNITQEEANEKGVYRDAEDNRNLAENLTKIVESFGKSINKTTGKTILEGYATLIRLKIDALSYNPITEQAEDAADEGEKVSGDVYVDGAAYKTDPEKSGSGRTKRIFYAIPVRDKSGETIPNLLMQDTYYDSGAVFNFIIEQMAGLRADEIMDALNDLANNNFIAKDVYTKLKEVEQTLPNVVNEFISVVRKQQVNFITPKYKIPKSKGDMPTVQIIYTNRGGISDVLVQDWRASFFMNLNSTGDVQINKDEYIISKEASDKIAAKIRSFNKSKNPTSEDFLNIMKSMGIELTKKAYEKLSIDFAANRKYGNRSFTSRFGKDAGASTFNDFLYEAFLSKFQKSLKRQDSIYSTEATPIKNLAFYQSKFEQDVASKMFKNSKGDNIYGYVSPHHASNTYDQLSSNPELLEELMQDPFVKRSTWLNKIKRFNELKESNQNTDEYDTLAKEIDGLGLFYLDASKNDTKGAMVKAYQEQNVAEKEVTKLNLFVNGTSHFSLTIGPTHSDKTTFALIKYLTKNTKSFTFVDGVLSIATGSKVEAEALKKELYDLFVQSEVDRINNVSQLYSNATAKYHEKLISLNSITKIIPMSAYDKKLSLAANEEIAFNHAFGNLIEGYHYIKSDKGIVPGTGTYFFNIPEMNNTVLKHGMRDVKTGELTIDTADATKLTRVLLRNVSNLAKYKMQSWEEMGITKDGQFQYIDKAVNVKYSNNEEAALSFVINNMIALANHYMVVSGDPAMFGKIKGFSGNYSDFNNVLESSHSNMFKRLAKDIAPGMEALWDKKTYTTLFIKEPKSGDTLSEYSDKLMNAYGFGIELADAQEWTTLEEHLETLKAYGRLTREEVNDIIKNRDNLNASQLAGVLQPLKPVQVIKQYEDDLGHIVDYYIKTSSFPLIPQLTKTFEGLDKMRRMMEANGIDRMVPKTAVKVGFRNSIDLENDNLFEGDVLKDQSKILTMTRDGFRIQQDIPSDISKEKVIEGSQFRKIITSNLITENSANLEFSLNEEEYNGRELKELNDDIHIKLFNNKWTKLLKDLGAVDNGDGIQMRDVTLLKKMMIEEAVEREYGENEILALRTITANGITIFETPLYFHPMIHKIESLLTSVIKNKVLKQKFPGKSYVQGSSYGFKAKTEAFLDLVGGKDGIVFTHEYESEKGLQVKRSEDGILEYQIMIPMPYKQTAKGGKRIPLNINDYMTDGYLDETKMSPEMLDMIGYRIPTQNNSSMVKLKVVGFLPEKSGDLVIIPPAMSKQMGSDFDVDKLNIHWYNYNLSKKGKITKIQSEYKKGGDLSKLSDKQLQNLSLELSHAVMENETIQDRTAIPLDNNIIKNVINKIEKLKPKKKSSNSMHFSVLNDEMHSEMVEIQAAGQIGVGVESVANTFHTLGQYAGLYIKNIKYAVKFSVKEKGFDEFKDSESTELSNGQYKPTKNSINKTLSYSKPKKTSRSQGAWRLDKIFAFDGRLISDILVNIQTEAVDNANNRKLYPMNLNKQTFDVANYIARTGFNEEFIGFFLNQPIIREYVEKANKLSNFFEKNFEANQRETLQINMLSEVGINVTNINDLATVNLSMKEMEAGIKDDKKVSETQAKALINFILYDKASKLLNAAQKTANVDTKYLGSSISSMKSRLKNKDEALAAENIIGNTYGLHNNKNHETMQGSAYEIGILKAALLYDNILPIFNNVTATIEDKLELLLNRKFREEELVDVNIGMRSAMYGEVIKDVFEIDDIRAYRKKLLFGDNSLGNRLMKFKSSNKNNLLTKSLHVEKNIEEGYDVIVHNSAKDDKANINRRKQTDWLDMLDADKGSVEYALARDLLIYSTIFGTERTANDFGRFMPNDFMVESGIVDKLREISFYGAMDGISKKVYDNFFIQYIQHNPKLAKSLPKDMITQKLNAESSSFDIGVKGFPFNGNNPYLIKIYNSDKFEYSLFKHMSNGKYSKIGLLGKGEISEYDLTIPNGNIKSLFNEAIYVKASTPTNTKKTKFNNIVENILNKYQFKKGSKAILELIAAKSKSEATREIAKLFAKNKKLLGRYELDFLDYKNPNHHSLGDNSDLKGCIRKASKGGGYVLVDKSNIESEEDFEKTFLHEITHVFTSEIMDRRANATEEQQKLMTNIGTLKNAAKKADVDSKFAKYYANDKEYIAGVMSDQEFQKFLNEVKFKKSRSILSEIFETIRRLVGIEVKEGNVLAQSMNEIISLIDRTKADQLDEIGKEYQNADFTTEELQEADEIRKKCKGLGKSTKKRTFGN